MKPFSLLSLLLTASAASILGAQEAPAPLGGPRPDGHAPIGVMADHMHGGGEWMASYRYMHMSMDGLNRSDQQARQAGFGVVPEHMTMDMHMFGLMYAPTDSLTLMFMTNYVTKDMEMRTLNSHSGHGMEGHAMSHHRAMNHGMSGHETGHGTLHDSGHASDHGSGRHSHSTSGWGDTTVSAMFRLFKKPTLNAHATLGIGLPTAEVEEMMHGSFQPYGMQLGNGVWDVRPSVTVNGFSDFFSWGGQVNGRLSLEGENDAGFRYGDQFGATTWAAVPVSPSISFSGRLLYQYTAELEGQYPGPHGHSSTPFDPANYGGESLFGAVGVNVLGLNDWIQGHRIALEFLFPLSQDLNGIQLETEYSLVLGWQKAF